MVVASSAVGSFLLPFAGQFSVLIEEVHNSVNIKSKYLNQFACLHTKTGQNVDVCT